MRNYRRGFFLGKSGEIEVERVSKKWFTCAAVFRGFVLTEIEESGGGSVY